MLLFDMVRGSSPILNRMDVKRNSDTLNCRDLSALMLKRPMNCEARMFYTYIRKDHDGNQRLQIELVTN